MVEVQQDPFEPPKFQRKKVPGGPPSPPVPVMHSPPRKVSAADQAAWKIPPCVSNWKNSKGYTRPLDKLLAADGRGLQDPQINDNFAKVSEALYIAERVAREEVEQRASMEKLRATKKKEHKEEELREMAEKLRDERTRGMIEDEEEEEDDDLALRDEIRDERRRERERDRRLEAAGKKTKLSRDRDRDVGEQIALGMTAKTSEELQYDQRLFNQTAGMDSGFSEEDAYNIYDKPLMKGTSASMLYKPKGGDDEQYGEEKAQEDYDKLSKSNRFQPDKGFDGADGGERGGSKRPRDNPVEFEKQEADPFGLDQFLSEAKKGKKAMDKIASGSKGHGSRKIVFFVFLLFFIPGSMAAGAGGSSSEFGGGSGRQKVVCCSYFCIMILINLSHRNSIADELPLLRCCVLLIYLRTKRRTHTRIHEANQINDRGKTFGSQRACFVCAGVSTATAMPLELSCLWDSVPPELPCSGELRGRCRVGFDFTDPGVHRGRGDCGTAATARGAVRGRPLACQLSPEADPVEGP